MGEAKQFNVRLGEEARRHLAEICTRKGWGKRQVVEAALRAFHEGISGKDSRSIEDQISTNYPRAMSPSEVAKISAASTGEIDRPQRRVHIPDDAGSSPAAATKPVKKAEASDMLLSKQRWKTRVSEPFSDG